MAESTTTEEDKKLHPFSRSISGKRAMWEQRTSEHQSKQESNPFSGSWDGTSHRVTFNKKDPNYGRPPPGSKTEARGLQAGHHISGEVVELCEIIYTIGQPLHDRRVVTFGKLFQTYTAISNKLVGMLMRARKHGLVEFEGEMLFQRRDDDKLIYLVKLPAALKNFVQEKEGGQSTMTFIGD